MAAPDRAVSVVPDAAAVSPLPLRLQAFEACMFGDDDDDYPMAFQIRLRVSGRLDRERFLAALRTAVERHPLLAARVEGTKLTNLTWVAAADPTPYVDFGAEHEPACYPDGSARIDLRRTTGLRVWCRMGTERGDIRFQFHHACCDGIGAAQFLGDLLNAYHGLTTDDRREPQLRSLEPARLARRTAYGYSRWRRLLRFPVDVWGTVFGAAEFFWRHRPLTVLSPNPPTIVDDQARLVDLPAESVEERELKAIRTAARKARTTLHEWLLTDLFLAIDRWNRSVDDDAGGRCLRIMVPFNLRAKQDQRLPAANVVGMIHLDRKVRPSAPRRRLLRSLTLDMKFLNYFRFAVSQPIICKLLLTIPGAFERIRSAPRTKNRCYATATFSHIGRLAAYLRLPHEGDRIHVGGLTVDAFEAAPPIRRLSPISITTLIYAERLHFVMNYDRLHFTPDDARKLLGLIVAQVRRSLAEAEHVSEPVERSAVRDAGADSTVD